MTTSDVYRQLPKVDALLAEPRLADLPRPVVVGAARVVLARVREGIAAGTVREVGDLVPPVLAHARLLLGARIQRTINATGVVVHTNLGRAPWSPGARAAAVQAMGYCNVEMDLETGLRGGRMEGLEALLAHLCGAEAALVVNNNAAAVLLALTALARDREVVVSRGELVEIGGSFRIPDVIASGGARLREVGTTNRTRLADYAAAIGPDTAVLLKVHPSNFALVGFTEEVERAELARLAAARGVISVEDLGSGSLLGELGEPGVREVLAAGIELVTFSGDKLLGGPQAGIVVGRPALVEQLRRHPLYRALRVDKVILAALERTLADHAAGDGTPVGQMVHAPPPVLATRAARLQELLAAQGVTAEVVSAEGRVGGGALPSRGLPGPVVRWAPPRVDEVARALRLGAPPVVARVVDGHLVLDVRTLADEELVELAGAVGRALGHGVRSG